MNALVTSELNDFRSIMIEALENIFDNDFPIAVPVFFNTLCFRSFGRSLEVNKSVGFNFSSIVYPEPYL